MKLEVTAAAADWFIAEMGLKENDNIMFFGKVYGTKDGFSFSLAKTEPTRPLVIIQQNGINFFIEKADEWFFPEVDLKVSLDPEKNEPMYEYSTTKKTA